MNVIITGFVHKSRNYYFHYYYTTFTTIIIIIIIIIIIKNDFRLRIMTV